ncbi:MAG: AAA family ATPase [Myxococcota bacterium]
MACRWASGGPACAESTTARAAQARPHERIQFTEITRSSGTSDRLRYRRYRTISGTTVLQSITIRGYRCFTELKAEGLTRVNLLVGKNNAGKTSLLEALELLLLRAQPDCIIRSSWRREEMSSHGVGPSRSEPEDLLLDARQLFHGRHLDTTTSFLIEGTDEHDTPLKIDVWIVSDPDDWTLATSDERGNTEEWELQKTSIEIRKPWRYADFDRMISPFIFASMAGIDSHERARLWNLIVGNESEDFVTSAIQILEPEIERVIFTVGDGYNQTPAAFVRMKGMAERVPLGSLGHGASRLLDLALLMVQARGGAFLVDEIEIGLHHSTMESVWRLIIENARRLDLQVFATTHSQDCLRALANLYRDDRSMSDTVSLHRLDVGASRTERFSMDDLEIADEAHLELRGNP